MFDKPIEIYDIEVAPNFFSYIGLSSEVDIDYVSNLVRNNYGTPLRQILTNNNIPFNEFVINETRNDFEKLIRHIYSDIILVGFNNHDYDDVILKFLLLIVSYKNRKPALVNGLKMYVRNSKGMLSTKEYPIFEGDKIRNIAHLNHTIYMMSQYIISIDFKSKNKNKIFQALKNLKAPFQSIDLFEIMEMNEKKSLKMLAIMYKWWIIQDLPYKFDEKVTSDRVSLVLDYNCNDVLITALSFKIRLKDLKLRKKMMDKYNHTFKIMSLNKSNIANLFIMTDYSEISKTPVNRFKYLRTERNSIAINDLISCKVHFKDLIKVDIDEMVYAGRNAKKVPKPLFKQCSLNDFLNYIRSLQIVRTNEIDFIIHFPTGVSFNFKSGGLHSVDNPRKLQTIPGEVYYKDFDFGSYYPGFVISEYVAPKHLNAEAFHALAIKYTSERLEYKSLLKVHEYGTNEYEDADTGASSLKIVINAGLFGKFGSEDSFLYDLAALLTVTINGQLILLMLAERYTAAGLKVVNANTDGLICEIKHDQLDTYYEIGKEFAEMVEIPYEYTDYYQYTNRDINNYIAVKEGAETMDYAEAIDKGLIKQKGFFVDTIDPSKGYENPIIPYAVNKYFIDGSPVEQTIKHHCDNNPDNIMDFCFAQKIDANKFNMQLIYPNGQRLDLQKNVRAYISTKPSKNGLYGQLYKKRIEPLVTETRSGKVSVNHGSFFKEKLPVTIFNDWFPVKDASEYNIDYNYYISKAKETIRVIEYGIMANTPAQRKKKIKQSISDELQGKLF